jgi:winged helix DNA-binding protein
MQAQDPKAPYIGLWSRLQGFGKDKLTRAYERRQVVRGTLFRVTVQLVSGRDHPAFSAVMQNRWKDEFANWGIPRDELAARIHKLAEDGPFAMAKANAITPELPERYRWRVRCLTPLVHVPPAGTWGTVGITATTAERWLGMPPPTQAEGASLVVRRYLGAFGPASREDLLRFAALRVKDVQPGFDELEPQLLRFESEDGRTLYDLRRAPRPAADTPAPVRFLPMWDHFILGLLDRTRTLPQEYQSAVIQKNGDVLPTFLVDGVVAGLWRLEDEKVKLEPFTPLPRAVRRELDDEARRLAAFLR